MNDYLFEVIIGNNIFQSTVNEVVTAKNVEKAYKRLQERGKQKFGWDIIKLIDVKKI